MSKISSEQARMMKHALGCNHKGMEPGWRNRYCTYPGSFAFTMWKRLEAQGFADDGGELNGGSHFFYVTETGRAALKARDDQPQKAPGKAREAR